MVFMCQLSVGSDGELEAIRNAFAPLFHALETWYAIKSRVYFNKIVELGAHAKLQELLLRGVRPATHTDHQVQMRPFFIMLDYSSVSLDFSAFISLAGSQATLFSYLPMISI